ncbi:MAG: DUF4129 domain-containing protein, partial [Firmicutes bacterium]|nr:DUF4129 domain-containing protein [Bacillota bacterium]
FSWLSGAFFPAAFAAGEGGRPIPIKVLEGSLLLAGPAVFLLAYLSFSASFLAVVIACWFAVMALSLALEGTYLWSDTNPRYDLIFFHLIVPALGGAAFYFAAFTGGFWAFLEGTRSLLAYLGALLFRLLSLIGPMPEVEPLEPEPITFSVEEEVIEAVAEMIPLYITILIVLSVVIGIIALLTFIAWLKTRLQAAPVQRRRKAFSFWKTLKQAWRLLALLMQQLWLGVQHACLSLKHGAVHLSQKLYVFLLRLFPARTPYEKIHRCYQSFLKWGRKLGCRKLPCETPLEYLKRLQASHKKQALALEEAAEMTRLFQEACYSSRLPDRQQARHCQKLLQKIKQKLF